MFLRGFSIVADIFQACFAHVSGVFRAPERAPRRYWKNGCFKRKVERFNYNSRTGRLEDVKVPCVLRSISVDRRKKAQISRFSHTPELRNSISWILPSTTEEE